MAIPLNLTRAQEEALIMFAVEVMLERGMEAQIDKEIKKKHAAEELERIRTFKVPIGGGIG